VELATNPSQVEIEAGSKTASIIFVVIKFSRAVGNTIACPKISSEKVITAALVLLLSQKL
jgi:hypothetical protein